MEELRIVRLVVPGRAPGSILVDSSGNIPALRLSLEPGDTTVGAVARSVLPSIGFDGHLLDFYIDQSRDYSAADVVPAYVELAAPHAGWRPPDGWHEVALSARELVVEPELAGRLAMWVDEQLGLAAPDPQRVPWAVAGWYERACEWIQQQLAEARRGPATEVVQHRHWGISSVMRVETPGGRMWFKALFGHFRHEPAVTAALAELAPGATAAVVAWDASQGWLLMADIPGDTAPDEHGHRVAFERLVQLQAAARGREADLVASGCARRPLLELPAQLAEALDDPILSEWLAVDDARKVEVVDWLVQAIRRIEQLDLPDVLVHGDLHPGNVRVVGDRLVLFDWSDAAITKPFVDVITWATWLPHDAAARDALWQSFADAWSDVLPAASWRALRPMLEGVAGAYHVVSYAGIVRALEPVRRAEHGGGLAEFFRFLDAAASDAAL